MIKLSPRNRHYLVMTLADHFDEHGVVKALCDFAHMEMSFTNINGSPVEMWHAVIKEMEAQEKTLNLLEHLIAKYPHNDRYQECMAELKTKQDERLDIIVQAIEKDQCVLFLGPGALMVRENNHYLPFNELLAGKLADDLDQTNQYYDPGLRKNLSYMAQKYMDRRMNVDGDVARFARKLFEKSDRVIDREIFRQLAALNFNVVINTNADDTLYKVMNEGQKAGKVGFSYYDATNRGRIKVKGEMDNIGQLDSAVVYNIFGSYNTDLSILYTEGQFLNFIIRILQDNPPLNERIMAEFDRKQYYLFLGFDFDQWYFKILFEVLKLRKEEARTVSLNASASEFTVYNREFYEKEFKFYFINDDLTAFLAGIEQKYKAVAPASQRP